MRLTAELVHHSLSYLNPLKERELDLRGHKIPALENLGLITNEDAIDFTDNDIPALANFPKNHRLKALYLARNRITAIASGLHNSIPNLDTLVLTQNSLSELGDLDPLAELKKLTHLTLLDNPVASRENYRYWVIARCPSVRFLDFQKVKDAERSTAAELFGTVAEPTELAQKLLSSRSSRSINTGSSTANANGADKISRVKLTDKERKRIEELIRNAKTLAEITRLEKALNEGRIPAGVLDDAMDTS
ncbi:U2-associated snRNP A [Aureobasidium pullulans]|uniref:U2 small nuclear ribonucleoprotein A' n=1 Tax=Aureobasidium pullulans TaxID=5580 RepID=A0A4S9C5W4_AURPU|nr:U2-associated snRNP A [Aureobasidium pullulans]THW95706.1 U2-associated snRNP A [Aureobasidium pullulans]THX01966.1 U2-associated snRNP A [Aureobasidium pullulans]THX79266.1 U2-associated snRNP A [Aureobasidium pullulans]THZ07893.1 U2-associated snRNP A [Aureobasidium pullulans]